MALSKVILNEPFQISPKCISLKYGRRLEYPERTHAIFTYKVPGNLGIRTLNLLLATQRQFKIREHFRLLQTFEHCVKSVNSQIILQEKQAEYIVRDLLYIECKYFP